jgi:uncharacterized phage-associated protein
VASFYHEYKEHGSGPIPVPSDIDFSKYSTEERELLDEVYSVYGQYSAWKLRNMTHEEPPWIDANAAGGSTISHEAMTEYFKTLLK